MEELANIGTVGKYVIEQFNLFLIKSGLSDSWVNPVRTILLFISVILLSLILWWITRKILINILHKIADRSKTTWDDYLVEKRFFAAIAHLVPLFFMGTFVRIVFINYPSITKFLIKSIDIVIIFVVAVAIVRFLATFEKILSEKERLKDKPIQSYFQLGKILVSGFMIILGLSIATGQSPLYFLTSLGAMTAILLLIFKDTILGFVGSIQLAANDMVRIGDWVTMEKYGADGDVIEINLATVKVQNFDKTITTIPTYSFISDSFKNWRGMQQSDGRRIKRSINIEINSVCFFTNEKIKELKKINLLTDYISLKEKEIDAYNTAYPHNKEVLINGRRQTNIGIYRAYITEYLKHNKNINTDMTLMVRQLAPTPLGIPVEVYCFSKIKDWTVYEQIVADLFDHLFAATSYFDLVIYERPSGNNILSALNDN